MIEINKKIKRQLTTLAKEKIDASGIINNIIVNQNANKKKKQKGSNKSA